MSEIVTLPDNADLFGQDVAATRASIDEPLAVALSAQMNNITLEQFVSYFINHFEAVVDYANLCAGEKTGQRISLLFNPHRLDTGTKRFPISLYAALKNEQFVRGLVRAVLLNKSKGVTKDLLYTSIGMGVQGASYVREFPPHAARDLALEYHLTKDSRVLDPCGGWGGRMIGCSTVVNSYTCCEPLPRTAAGLRQLLTFLQAYHRGFTATIYQAPFEDIQLQNGAYDFALTSPPSYTTSTSYPTLESWIDGCYTPLIHRTIAALKPGACFVIHIGSRLYPLSDHLFAIARDHYPVVEKSREQSSSSDSLWKEGETFYEVRRPADAIVAVLDASLLTSVLNPYTPEPVQDASGTMPSASKADMRPSLPALTPRAPDANPDASARPARAVSAFDFALLVGVQTPAVYVGGTHATATVDTATPQIGPLDLKRDLEARGHRLLTREGRFFISDASRLTDDDRAQIKRHRDALILLAEPLSRSTDGDVQASACSQSAPDKDRVILIPGIGAQVTDDGPTGVATLVGARQDGSEPSDSFFNASAAAPTQTLAQFLGTTPQSAIVTDFVSDEPPDLSGVETIVLNFATNGFKWHAGDRPVGVTVSTLDGQLTRFLPFAFTGGGNLDESAVKRWAIEQLRSKKIIGSKIRFDIHHAREWGVDLEAQGCTFSDVQHTAALLDDHRKRFALDVLAADYLPHEQIVGRVDESRHAEYHASEVATRERYTAQLVGKLRNVMQPQIDAQELGRVQAIEDRVIPAVVEMEKNGAQIDLELLDEFHRECHAEYERLMREISDEVGFAFEHTSKGWQRLLELLHLSVPDSFAEHVLNAYDHPLVKKGQLASQHASLNSKVFDAYTQAVDANGLLRFEINQLRGDEGGTVSGRFSIGYVQQVPNLDNHTTAFGDRWFPRRLFVPFRDVGNTAEYLEADAAQIEYRLFAHYANNPSVLAAYAADPWLSFHKMTWGMMKAYKPDMLYTHQKSFNFAKQYGARSIKLAVMMGFITAEEGDEIRAAKRWSDPRLTVIHEIESAYKRMMPEGDLLLDRASHLAKPECDKYCRKYDALHRQYPHRGYVKTLVGRRSRFPTNYKTYIGLNRVLQGTGADIMKVKLAELHDARKDTGLIMSLTVHDQIGGTATSPETAAKVSEVLNVQSFPELTVPILWECGVGSNWAACKG